MQGLGYRQMTQYLRGECTMEEAVANIKRDTRHFAKRQLTWFKREREVRFLDRGVFPTDDPMLEELLRQVREAWGS